MTRRNLRVLALALLVTLLAGIDLLIQPTTAFAHAAPAKITPGDGAVLTSGPARVTIEMTQELARQPGANDIDLLGPDGTEVTTEPAVLDATDRRLISVAVPPALPPGKYTIRWKSLSTEDGDPATGEEYGFTIDPAGTPAACREVVREALGGSGTSSPSGAGRVGIDGDSGPRGVSWVLVVALGLLASAVSVGATYMLVDRSAKRAGPKQGAPS